MKILSVIAALLLSSFCIVPSSVTYTWQWTSMVDPEDVCQPIQFPAFDPSLGQLEDVIVTIRCRSGSDLRGESLISVPSIVRAKSQFLGQIALTSNSNYSSSNRVNEIAFAEQRYHRDEPRLLSPFDGVDDFSGTSGYSWPITWRTSRYFTFHVNPSLWNSLINSSGSTTVYVWRNDPGLVHAVQGCSHQML